ncbi:hypothetical protein MKJ04_12760 [Pontibacter sp. E15-1]|nr:hypothetical protein [Pontibacter sp. E15-1]MCJ8165716.1 hypothetical protein [Pontibacter sp. E15-1]
MHLKAFSKLQTTLFVLAGLCCHLVQHHYPARRYPFGYSGKLPVWHQARQ